MSSVVLAADAVSACAPRVASRRIALGARVQPTRRRSISRSAPLPNIAFGKNVYDERGSGDAALLLRLAANELSAPSACLENIDPHGLALVDNFDQAEQTGLCNK